jgi:hypothetical protein
MSNAVDKVRRTLLKATAALEKAGIPYAVIGGNAVAAWVARADEAAVRNTRDVDLLVRRDDLDAIKTAMEPLGFRYRRVAILGGEGTIHMFVEVPGGKVRDGVHLLFAGEAVNAESLMTAPDVTESERGEDFTILSLEALVRMKLDAFRRKDQVHLEDFVSVGLVDETWLEKVPANLWDRLREILNSTERWDLDEL